MWSHEIVGTVTGDRLQSLPLADARWRIGMDGDIGRGSSVIETRADVFKQFTPEYWQDLVRPWRRTIVGKWNNAPVWAHVITGSTYNPRTGELQLEHSEIGELLKRRLFFDVLAYSSTASVSFGPFTREGMLTSVARHAAGGGYWAAVSPRRLPIHFEEPASGGWSRTTFQHEFEHPWDWMTAIADGDPGVDFVFAPGFGSDSGEAGAISGFQWRMYTGARIERSVHSYHVSAAKSPIASVAYSLDGVDHTTGVFALGEGHGSARPVGRVGTSETPEVPRVLSLGQEGSVSSLTAAAQGEWSALRVPQKRWDVELRADAVLAPMHGGPNDGLRPGSSLVLPYGPDPVLGSGIDDLYVTALSGDMSSLVKAEGQLI